MAIVIVRVDSDGYVVAVEKKDKPTIIQNLSEANSVRSFITALLKSRPADVRGLGTDDSIAVGLLYRSRDRLTPEQFTEFNKILADAGLFDAIEFTNHVTHFQDLVAGVADDGNPAKLRPVVTYFIDP